MNDGGESKQSVRFGSFEVDLESGELRRNGRKLKLTGQPLLVLTILIERPGHIITREELQKRLWPDIFVDVDHNLNTAINKIREVLGDSAENPRFVETLPRRGYRFIYPIEQQQSLSQEGNSTEAAEASSLQTSAEIKRPHAPLPRGRFHLATAGSALLLATALIAVNATGIRNWLTATLGRSTAASTPRIESIAVLPFENLSGDASQEYFADGMTEELITELGTFTSFRVISRTSVMRLKGSSKPLPEIARELGVDGIVEGTVARSGNHIRITANLLQAATDRHLWANSYESELEDILVVQGKVARSVANAIRNQLTRPEQLSAEIPPRVNSEAYQAYLEGRYHASKFSNDGWRRAETSLRRSIDLDPAFARPYGALAILYNYEAVHGLRPPTEVFPLAKAAALKALQLDDRLAEAHSALGMVKLCYDWDWAGSEQEHKRALLLNPSSTDAREFYGVFLTAMGRSDEAIREGREAIRLDPASPASNVFLAWYLYFARRHDESISQLKKVLNLDPQLAWPYMELGWNYAVKQMFAEATAECQRALSLIPDSQVVLSTCGGIYGQAGKRKEAVALLAKLKTLAREGYVDSWYIAWLYDGIGDTDECIAWLQKAYAERSANLYLLKVAVLSDRIRSDPRLQELLRKLNFPA